MGEFWRRRLRGVSRFVDGCAGSGAVAAWVAREFPGMEIVVNDADPWAACLLRAARTGWTPPTDVSEGAYRALQGRARAGEVSPEVAFAGFASSWRGKFFGGRTRPQPRQREPVRAAAEAWREDAIQLARADVREVHYEALPEAIRVRAGDLWYFDKPYAGTSGYGPPFDHAHFWGWAADLAQRVPLLVSEYQAPPGWWREWSVIRVAEIAHQKVCDQVFRYFRGMR